MSRILFSKKKLGSRIRSDQYDKIYWEGMDQAMKSYPRKFRNWVTKQASGMCGCTSARAKWDKDVEDKCPSCGEKGDTSTHVTRCQDPGRKQLLKDSINQIATWMDDNNTEPHLADMIKSYMAGGGKEPMVNIARRMHRDLPAHYADCRLERMALIQDRLGWDNLVEGRIPMIYVEHQRMHLASIKTTMTAKRWAKGLITRLLQMTHKQWLLRNAKVHIKRKGDLTAKEHDELLSKIESLIWTDPDDLLPGDEHLLNEDFDQLGRASAIDQQLWVAEMEASMTAANQGSTPRTTTNNELNAVSEGVPSTQQAMPVDMTNEKGSEGSGAWKRERWR